MEERTVLIYPDLGETEAIVHFALSSWRWGVRRVERNTDEVCSINMRYELCDRGDPKRYLLEVCLEKRDRGTKVSWRYPGQPGELLMASTWLIDFLRTGLLSVLNAYRL